MSNDWQVFEVLHDEASAEALAGRLRVDDVPAAIHRQSPVPGIEEFQVVVPARLAHRARWIMANVTHTSGELTYLATGELGAEPDTR